MIEFYVFYFAKFDISFDYFVEHFGMPTEEYLLVRVYDTSV